MTQEERIEKAAKKYCQDKNYILPDDTKLSLEALTAIDAYIEGGKNSLQNQWISVDEGLPKESGDYLVIVKQSSDSEAYFHEISTYNATDNIWFYVGKLIVTHWMPIPSLKGGEE